MDVEQVFPRNSNFMMLYICLMSKLQTSQPKDGNIPEFQCSGAVIKYGQSAPVSFPAGMKNP